MINPVDSNTNSGFLAGLTHEIAAQKYYQPLPLGQVPTNNTEIVTGQTWTQTVKLGGSYDVNVKRRVRHYTITWAPDEELRYTPVVQLGVGLSDYSWTINWSYTNSSSGTVQQSSQIVTVLPGAEQVNTDGSIAKTFDLLFGYPLLPTPPSGTTNTPSATSWTKQFVISAQAFSNVSGIVAVTFNGEEDYYDY